MKNYAEFNFYFRQIQLSHQLLKCFIIGNSERIISLQRSSIKYPCLWLEDADVVVPLVDTGAP
ncbi:MAG: hypothetical protein ABI002_14590, partial [Saprospiraceae bacterium]